MAKRILMISIFWMASALSVKAADISQQVLITPKTVDEELRELEVIVDMFREGYKNKLPHLAQKTPPTNYLNEKMRLKLPPNYYGSGSRY